jgi:hypothetical protein
MRGEHRRMTQDELQAMLSADEEHWWCHGRRQVLRAAIDASAHRATRIPRAFRRRSGGSA